MSKSSLRLLFLTLLSIAYVFSSVDELSAQREKIILRSEFSPATSLASNGGVNGNVNTFSQFVSWASRKVLDKKGTAILTSTYSYRYTDLNYDFEPEFTIQPEPLPVIPDLDFRRALNENGIQLHAFQASYLYMKILNRKWMLYALGRPSFFSDLDGITMDDFRFEGAVFTEYGFSRKFRAGLGISRSSGFGRVLWIPIARILYRPARKILIDGILPSRLDAWYIPSKEWELGLGLSLVGGQYSVGENALNGNQFGWANGLASAQVKRLLKGKWYAQFDVGISLIPRQEMTNYDFNLLPSRDILYDLDPNPMPVFRAGVFKVF